MSYLIFHNEQQQGPYEVDAIQDMIANGALPANVMLWQDGMSDWQSADTLLGSSQQTTEIVPTQQQEIQTVEAEVISVRSVDDKVDDAVNGLINRLISDEQDPGAVKKIVSKVTDLLTAGETIEYICVQKKPVVTISPDAIVLTNRRFIFVHPKLTGFSFTDFQWRQVHDVHLSEQMLGATISCLIVGGERAQLDSLPKKQARKVYSFAQQMEEAMIEERRERSMEEKRAGAGGVVIQNAVGTAQSQPESSTDPLEQLAKLKKMLDAGLIEAGEFESKKTEILSRM